MSSDMLGRLVQQLVQVPDEMVGALYDLMQKLSGRNRRAWFQALKQLLREEYRFEQTDIRSEWTEFYRKYFRISVDFWGIMIPNDPGGFDRVIFIPKGLTHEQVVIALSTEFKVSLSEESLGRDIFENVRDNSQNYVVRFRDRQEADEEFANISADHLKEQRINGITLLERLVYEFKYCVETGGGRLDTVHKTLCTGSRSSNGRVPLVYSYGGGLSIRLCPPGYTNSGLRVRQAVS